MTDHPTTREDHPMPETYEPEQTYSLNAEPDGTFTLTELYRFREARVATPRVHLLARWCAADR